jgi:hypothetical protein
MTLLLVLANRFVAYASGACAVLILTFGVTLPVFPQGLIPDTEDDLANIPRTPDYRAFLPERADLSDGFLRQVIKASRTLVSGGRSDTLVHITPRRLRAAI